MQEPLPVRRTRTFQHDLMSLIPKNNRKNLIFDLEHITKDDLRRNPMLKADFLKPFRSRRRGDFRTLYVYCFECFHYFNKRLNCMGCNENDLEKLVLALIFHRSKNYSFKGTELTNFTLFET
ncbi:MAG: hypothetical protein ACFFD7_11035 [Candidatus Thorarchaeota archaeon]